MVEREFELHFTSREYHVEYFDVTGSVRRSTLDSLYTQRRTLATEISLGLSIFHTQLVGITDFCINTRC